MQIGKETKAAVIAAMVYLTPVLYTIFYAFDVRDIAATIIVAAAILVYGWYLLGHQLGEYESEAVKSANETYIRKAPRFITLVVSGYLGAILLAIIAQLPANETPTLVGLINNLVGLDALVEPVEEGASPYALNLVIGLGIGLSLKIGAGIDNQIWSGIDDYLK